MKALWRKYAEKFDLLTLRERAMVSAAVLVALLAAGYSLLLEPQVAAQRRTSAAMLQKQSEMRALDAQLHKLIAARAEDPERARRERLAALTRELGELEGRIKSEERRFTRPSQVRSVIEGVLARSRGVVLVEMKTLAVSTLAPKESKEPRPIYRHGLEITVSGGYLDLLAYVRDLEALPTQLYWGALELDATQHPNLLMKLTVYTVSLDRAWLNV